MRFRDVPILQSSLFSYLKVSESLSVMSDCLWPHGQYSPWISLGHNTGVGSLSLLQGIFTIQRSNPGIPHCGQILYQLSHKGRPSILEWVAYPFSRGSSQPRNRTGVSCIAGRFFTNYYWFFSCLNIVLKICLQLSWISWLHSSHFGLHFIFLLFLLCLVQFLCYSQ